MKLEGWIWRERGRGLTGFLVGVACEVSRGHLLELELGKSNQAFSLRGSSAHALFGPHIFRTQCTYAKIAVGRGPNLICDRNNEK